MKAPRDRAINYIELAVSDTRQVARSTTGVDKRQKEEHYLVYRISFTNRSCFSCDAVQNRIDRQHEATSLSQQQQIQRAHRVVERTEQNNEWLSIWF